MKTLLLSLTSFLIFMNSYGQNALDFDGSGDYVLTTYSGVLGTADRTFEAWIKVPPGAPETMCIMDYGINAAGERNTLLVAPDRSVRYLSGGAGGNLVSEEAVVNEDEWTHVAFVLNSGTGFIYVNGIEVATGELPAVDTPDEDNFRIGQRVSGGSIPFEGIIDEVRVWDVARTNAEILDKMETELCNPEGLTAYFKFNQGEAGGVNTDETIAFEEVSGNDGELLTFALTGATSNWVVGVDLETLPTYTITNTYEECHGFILTVGESTYFESGVYTDVLTTVLGCDSTIITDLTIYPEAVNDLTINECGPYSITLNGVTYSETGEYTDTLYGEGFGGCDSIINLDLTVSEHAVNNLTYDECAGFSVTINDVTYTETGEYSETIIGGAANGCDSIINLDLTVASPIDISTTVTELIITANSLTGSYQWIDCETMMPIDGEIDQSFTVTENGEYAVIITEGDCADTSDCIVIDYVGLDDESTQSQVQIFPNPAQHVLTVNTHQSGNQILTIYDVLGKKYYTLSTNESTTHVNIQNLPVGSYFIEIHFDNKKETHFFVKE